MTSNRKIPFLDLVTPHLELKEELCRVFTAALDTGAFIGGAMVEEFENAFAKFCDTEYCIAVGSGTDALRFALMAAGIQPGTVVVTVPNTFIATAEAITQSGATPEFVDIDERTCNVDTEKLREYCEERCTLDEASGRLISRRSGKPVAAFVPVHLYGQPADMDPILELAGRYGLPVIEDACQAHGAEYFSTREQRWRRVGSMGKAAAFSFYPGKNLGACGEAGAVTTDDPEIAKKIAMLRDHGQARKYCHEMEGYNGRLDAIQAGILQVKLEHIARWNASRRENALRYQELLAPIAGDIESPYQPSWANGVYHLYVVRSRSRDALKEHLAEANIGTGIHYPIPLHLQNAYSYLGLKPGDFPVAERAAGEIISLPMYPGLRAAEQNRVAESLRAFASSESGVRPLAATV